MTPCRIWLPLARKPRRVPASFARRVEEFVGLRFERDDSADFQADEPIGVVDGGRRRGPDRLGASRAAPVAGGTARHAVVDAVAASLQLNSKRRLSPLLKLSSMKGAHLRVLPVGERRVARLQLGDGWARSAVKLEVRAARRAERVHDPAARIVSASTPRSLDPPRRNAPAARADSARLRLSSSDPGGRSLQRTCGCPRDRRCDSRSPLTGTPCQSRIETHDTTMVTPDAKHPDPYVKLPQEVWRRYEAVNAAIADEFYSGRYADRAVYLDLEDDVLGRIGDAIGGVDRGEAREALIGAVRPTLQLVDGLMVFGRHRQRRVTWRYSGRADHPPHLAILALLSLVAESMRADDSLSSSAYYGRFIEMAGGNPADDNMRKQVVKAHRTDVVAMWRELNDWIELRSARDSQRPSPSTIGTYIGPALTQALVREADRHVFADLFLEARLIPGQDMSRDDMVRLLRHRLPKASVSHGLRVMCRRKEALEHVADVALTELRTGDGEGRVEVGFTRGLRLAGRLRRLPRPALEVSFLARLPPSAKRHARLRPRRNA